MKTIPTFYLVISMAGSQEGQREELALTLDKLARDIRTGKAREADFIVHNSEGAAVGTANIFPMPIIHDEGSYTQ